jgi:hypothetical protein
MKKIEKLFIPKPLALIAKEKGFKEKCLGLWVNDDLNLDYDIKTNTEFSHHSHCLLAPTHQQVIDWLREQHNIKVSVIPFKDHAADVNDEWEWKWGVLSKLPYKGGLRSDYYEAIQVAIEYALNLITP